MIVLFLSKSVLLKIIPELGFAGKIEIFTNLPLCRPTPLKSIFLFTVFWFNADTKRF